MRLTSESIKTLHQSGAVVSASRPAFQRGTPAPRVPQTRPASDASIKYLRSLVEERYPQATEEYVQSVIDQGQLRVSKAIDKLKVMPRASRISAEDFGVPVGRYALRDDEGVVHFYWLKESGIYVQASDDFHRIANRSQQRQVIKDVQVDPKAAAILYGLELGVCGRCGRTLTDEDSRAKGIGPTCAQQEGWS